MIQEEHEQFAEIVKNFKAFESMAKRLISNAGELQAALIRWENKRSSTETEVKTKQDDLAKLENEIKQRRLQANSGAQAIREQFDKRHIELVERENTLRVREQVVAETQAKANALLVQAEAQSAKKVKKVEA